MGYTRIEHEAGGAEQQIYPNDIRDNRRCDGREGECSHAEGGRQMRLNRTIPEISGECFYSTRPLLRNPRSVCDAIKLIYKDDQTQNEPDFLPWE